LLWLLWARAVRGTPPHDGRGCGQHGAQGQNCRCNSLHFASLAATTGLSPRAWARGVSAREFTSDRPRGVSGRRAGR